MAENERKQPVGCGGSGGRCELMPPCHEAPSHSQRSSAYSSPNRSPSPGPPLLHSSSPASSKSSSRHSVSFQLHSPERADSPPPQPHPHPHDLLSDGFGQLLQALVPTDAPEVAPFKAGPPTGSTPCARLTVPPTSPAPHHHTRSQWTEEGDNDGRTSVVTYGYIEKSNVYSRGRRSSACHGSEGSLLPTQAHKRLSDPLWYSLHPCHTHSHLGHAGPHLQRVTLDAVARDATYRALEEFGSPELRRRFSGQGATGTCSPTLPRSWGAPSGPPPRSTYTLPPRVQLSRAAMNGLPRSPASDHLCSHTGYPAHPAVPPHGSQPRPWTEEGCLRLQPRLPAGRPTDIQHHVRYNAVDVPPTRSHISSPHCSSRTRTRSMSPSLNPNVAAQLAAEASRVSSSFADRRSPSPATSQASECRRSNSPQAAESIQRESQPYATLHGRRSPEHLSRQCSGPQNHSWSSKDPEMPQTRPGRISPASSRRTSPAPASPALPAQLHRSGASQNSPVLDPRRQQQQGPEASSRNVSSLNRYQQPQYIGDRNLSCERTSERPAGLSCRQHQQEAQSRLTPPNSDRWNRKKQSSASQERLHCSQVLTGSTGSTGSPGSQLSPHSVSQSGHVTSSAEAKVGV